MKGHRVTYRPDELKWLEANRTMAIRDYHRAFCEAFGRQNVSASNLHALRKRRGWKTGRSGRFEKGLEPHNKGKPFRVAATHPNCRKTQFKKGGLPHNTKFLGHERVSKDGYVEVSIGEINPHTGYERRYVLKHRYLWEQQHGPLPEGMCLKCLDGNRLNTDPGNWELIPRAMLPHLGARYGLDYDRAEPEVKPTIMALAKLKHAAKQKRRGAVAEN